MPLPIAPAFADLTQMARWGVITALDVITEVRDRTVPSIETFLPTED